MELQIAGPPDTVVSVIHSNIAIHKSYKSNNEILKLILFELSITVIPTDT